MLLNRDFFNFALEVRLKKGNKEKSPLLKTFLRPIFLYFYSRTFALQQNYLYVISMYAKPDKADR